MMSAPTPLQYNCRKAVNIFRVREKIRTRRVDLNFVSPGQSAAETRTGTNWPGSRDILAEYWIPAYSYTTL